MAWWGGLHKNPELRGVEKLWWTHPCPGIMEHPNSQGQKLLFSESLQILSNISLHLAIDLCPLPCPLLVIYNKLLSIKKKNSWKIGKGGIKFLRTTETGIMSVFHSYYLNVPTFTVFRSSFVHNFNNWQHCEWQDLKIMAFTKLTVTITSWCM